MTTPAQSGRDRLTRWRLVLGGEAADGIGAAGRPRRRRPAARRGAARRCTTATGPARRARRLCATGRTLAGRHPHLLPVLGRAGDAGRRDGPARPAPAAARARDDAGRPARHRHWSPRWSGSAGPSPSARKATARAVVRTVTDQLEERLRSETVQAVTGALNRAVAHPSAAARRHRLAAAPSPRTSSTTSPSTAPWCRSGWSVTPAGRARSSGTSSCASTSPGRWPSRSSTPACSARCSPRCGRSSTRLVVFDTDRRRPHRRPRRPGRRAVRRAARRRHRHQPGAGLLPGPGRAPGRDGPGADQRPLRGRHRRGDGAPGLSPGRLGRDDGRAARAVSDSGARASTPSHAQALAAVGVPAFACTPDLFPDLMACAIEGDDIGSWASAQGIVTSHAEQE